MKSKVLSDFINFKIIDRFNMIIDLMIDFKFFHFILQISLSSDLQNSD